MWLLCLKWNLRILQKSRKETRLNQIKQYGFYLKRVYSTNWTCFMDDGSTVLVGVKLLVISSVSATGLLMPLDSTLRLWTSPNNQIAFESWITILSLTGSDDLCTLCGRRSCSLASLLAGADDLASVLRRVRVAPWLSISRPAVGSASGADGALRAHKSQSGGSRFRLGHVRERLVESDNVRLPTFLPNQKTGIERPSIQNSN